MCNLKVPLAHQPESIPESYSNSFMSIKLLLKMTKPQSSLIFSITAHFLISIRVSVFHTQVFLFDSHFVLTWIHYSSRTGTPNHISQPPTLALQLFDCKVRRLSEEPDQCSFLISRPDGKVRLTV